MVVRLCMCACRTCAATCWCGHHQTVPLQMHAGLPRKAQAVVYPSQGLEDQHMFNMI